ncbi:MAG: GGDEF domain-containing protein [Acidobacteria bacterium]|nr:GGDEF domain-containing protein [Acidobacteriota bacterium]
MLRVKKTTFPGIDEELRYYKERLHQVSTWFESFVDAVEALGNNVGYRAVIESIIARVASETKSELCLVYLYNDAYDRLELSSSVGRLKEHVELMDFEFNRTIVNEVFTSGLPYTNNEFDQTLKLPLNRKKLTIHSILCFPLTEKEKRVGVIEVLNKDQGNGFTEEDQKLMELMIRPVTAAIENAVRFEKTEQLSLTDDLTGLYNYRYLKQFLSIEIKRCLRYKKDVSLLFIDIDRFKTVNDTFGHLVGSATLAEVGHIFKRTVRETDVVIRYGGDEYVIILPETSLNGSVVMAERLRKKIENHQFAVGQENSFKLTISLGVASCPKHSLSAEGLIQKADAAMYLAKEISRNRIKVAS